MLQIIFTHKFCYTLRRVLAICTETMTRRNLQNNLRNAYIPRGFNVMRE